MQNVASKIQINVLNGRFLDVCYMRHIEQLTIDSVKMTEDVDTLCVNLLLCVHASCQKLKPLQDYTLIKFLNDLIYVNDIKA